MYRLLAEPRRVLVAILVGNTLVNIGAASMATAVAIRLFEAGGSHQSVQQGMLWSTLVMTALILFFGEIAPKSFAIENADRLSQIAAGPLGILTRVIGPVGIALERLSSRVIATFNPPGLAAPVLSSRELARAIEVGHYQGVVDAFEREVIGNILDLGVRSVADVMTPRVDVESIDLRAPAGEWPRRFRETGFSRLPLVFGDLDHIEGILYAKDILSVQLLGAAPTDLKSLARDPYFVPESMKTLELLQELRSRQIHFAVVMNEYGSVSGVVTMEDVLEEIVGDIADSRDQEEAPFKLLGSGVAVVFAGWELAEFAEATGTVLTDPHAETVGGWVSNRLGRIPRTGESLRIPPFRVHVLSARPNRVLWLRVEWSQR